MRHIVAIIILISISFVLSGQTRIENFTNCIIKYNGDSTLLTERYEIDIVKKKVSYINPIMNYLHLKGEKYRTPIKITKQDWKEILIGVDSIYTFNSPDTDSLVNKKVIYSIEYYNSTGKIKEFVFFNETIPSNLKRLFEIIRNDD